MIAQGDKMIQRAVHNECYLAHIGWPQEAETDSQTTAYIVPIHGEIEPSRMIFVRRGIQKAESDGADFIIFDIDTFGGRVDSALQIATLIGSARSAITIAFVPATAEGTGVSWSAGALISFACNRIYMAPGTSIGAAAPVFNLYRDPREEEPFVGLPLWSGASFQDMVKRHMMMIAKYPHAQLGKGIPYEGIENLRPESKETVATFMSWQPSK